jgi:hypothetical protein
MKRHQIKSSPYYIFWAIMAIAVVGGQVYVGSGYRILSRELKAFTQGIYDSQMGWDARQQVLEQKAQGTFKQNRTFEFE